MRLYEAKRALIWRFDGQMLRGVATCNVSPERRAFLESNPISPGRDTAGGRAALEGRTIQVHDIQADPEYTYRAGQVDPIPTRTLLAIPMLRMGELLGVITIFRHEEVQPFTDSQIALWRETFADQAAIAIENARLLTGPQTRNADLTDALGTKLATSEILRVISQSPTDAQPVFEAIVASAARLCVLPSGLAVARFDRGLLHLVAHNNMSPAETAAYPLDIPARTRPSFFIIGRAFVDGQPVHVEDVSTDPDYDPRTLEVLQRAAPYRTYLGIPSSPEWRADRRSDAAGRRVKSFTPNQVNRG